MKFDYNKQGDILYGCENYRFRYGGTHGGQFTADIELLHMLDDDGFAFQIYFDKAYKPTVKDETLSEISNSDYKLYQNLGKENDFTLLHSSRQEALQGAINIMYAALKDE